ncbi:MAG: beta-ketoacyl synthase N-terminal-like domain-containing protein, partial [Verrucomicrobiota bacterium]
MPEHVVITGWGVLNAVGEDVSSFAESLEPGFCGVTLDEADGLGLNARMSAVPFAERLARRTLPEPLIQRARRAGNRATRPVQTALLGALEAWEQARLEADDVHLVVAGHNMALADQYRAFEKFREHPEYLSARHALQFMDTDHVGTLSDVLGLREEGLTVGGASASGNVGLLEGWRRVRAGWCRACVVVGGMADLSPVERQAFFQTGAMGGKRFAHEPARACRPFDADREGFIPGQGAACLILEGEESARARGAEALGRLAGAALCLDGNRLSDPNPEGEARAMGKAIDAAGLSIDDIDTVNAHGTSSVAGDAAEIEALKAVFGARLPEIPINATKGLTGHGLYAAGLIEAVASLIQLRRGFLHPNRNLDNPMDPEIRFVGPAAEPFAGRSVLSNAFGFGGINTAVV